MHTYEQMTADQKIEEYIRLTEQIDMLPYASPIVRELSAEEQTELDKINIQIRFSEQRGSTQSKEYIASKKRKAELEPGPTEHSRRINTGIRELDKNRNNLLETLRIQVMQSDVDGLLEISSALKKHEPTHGVDFKARWGIRDILSQIHLKQFLLSMTMPIDGERTVHFVTELKKILNTQSSGGSDEKRILCDLRNMAMSNSEIAMKLLQMSNMQEL